MHSSLSKPFLSFFEVDYFFLICTEFVTTWLLFYVLVFGHKARGIAIPQPGIKPTSPALEGEVPDTGPPGKFTQAFLKYFY